MNALGYNLLAALSVIGSVVAYIATGEAEVAIALIGLAGTVAGRGKSA